MNRRQLEVTTLEQYTSETPVTELSMAERFLMVWPLTLDAWMFKDPNAAESRFQRHQVVLKIEGNTIRVIGRTDLVTNKRAAGRPKDILDADTLDANME